MHQHDHSGHDHHHHSIDVKNVSRMLVFGMILNLIYVIVEAGAGLYTGSLSLLSDAGHNFSDASGLFLAWLAFRLMRIRSTKRNTYGQRKTSILISLLNSLLIVLAVAWIFREAIHRFNSPTPFNGYTVSIVAGIGVVINFFTAYLLFRDRDKDLNVKGAYLHMIADGLVSVGVIISGIVYQLTALSWIDPAVSMVIGGIVLYSTWGLLRDSARLATDGIPRSIDLQNVQHKMSAISGVVGVHHVHVWAISTTENALTAHLIIKDDLNPAEIEKIKKSVRHELEHLQIVHSTLEIEYESSACTEKSCAFLAGDVHAEENHKHH